MFQDRCVSITDLRTRTKECLSSLEKKPKYVFVNNKPVAVLLGIQDFERSFDPIDFHQLSKQEVSPALLHAATRARKTKKQDLVNL
jgi:hypothetical protein